MVTEYEQELRKNLEKCESVDEIQEVMKEDREWYNIIYDSLIESLLYNQVDTKVDGVIPVKRTGLYNKDDEYIQFDKTTLMKVERIYSAKNESNGFDITFLMYANYKHYKCNLWFWSCGGYNEPYDQDGELKIIEEVINPYKE